MRSIFVITALAGCAISANADTLDFSGLAHGEIVAEQYAGLGVHISAINPNQPFDLASAFDTTSSGNSDDDLEDPWTMGNMPLTTVLGNVLIIQENDFGIPDDEGGRPAGSLIIDFDSIMSGFGFDVVDVEDVVVESTNAAFYLDGLLVETLEFEELLAGGSHDVGAVFGNGSINHVAEFGVTYDRVIFNAGGSMGFDNIVYSELPTPGALALLGLGGVMMGRRRG